jgi:hypothetical protein
MLLHTSNITTWSDCIRRTTTNHPLNMKTPLGKCPVGLDQNSAPGDHNAETGQTHAQQILVIIYLVQMGFL